MKNGKLPSALSSQNSWVCSKGGKDFLWRLDEVACLESTCRNSAPHLTLKWTDSSGCRHWLRREDAMLKEKLLCTLYTAAGNRSPSWKFGIEQVENGRWDLGNWKGKQALVEGISLSRRNWVWRTGKSSSWEETETLVVENVANKSRNLAFPACL